MDKKRLALIAGTVFMVGSLAGCGPRCSSNEESAECAEWMVERVSRKLDLDSAQQAKLEALKRVLLEARAAAMVQRDTNRREVLALLAAPQLDRSRAEALVQSHVRTLQSKSPAVITAMGDFFDSLTPEQQQALRENVESRMNRRRWH